MKQMTLAGITVMALFLLLTVGAPTASADPLTFQLTSDHCGSTDNTNSNDGCLLIGQSAGTVTVSDISGGIAIVVTLNSGFQFFGSGGGGNNSDFGFNLNVSSITSGDSQPDVCGAGGTGECYQLNSTLTGSNHLDGAGNFAYAFTALFPNGATDALNGPFTFNIMGSITTANITTNSVNQYFALDIINKNEASQPTGFVDASAISTTPDGGMTLMLLGGVLVGLEGLRRKLRA